jgi:hypothetical protein
LEAIVSESLFSVAEKVHVVRIALQQQWICDIEATPEKRWSLRDLGFRVATANPGYVVATGSEAIAEFVCVTDPET